MNNMDDYEDSANLSKEWERNFLGSNRVWWITGVSLLALALGTWNYLAINQVREEARSRKTRQEIDAALDSLDRIDGGINVRSNGIEDLLKNRKELTFHDLDAKREPVLLKRFFKGREKVKYDSVEYELGEVLSVAYSPNNGKGAVLFDLGSIVSDYDIVIFNTRDSLNQKVIEVRGQTISEVSWEDNKHLVYKSVSYMKSVIPRYIKAKISKNNVVEERSEYGNGK